MPIDGKKPSLRELALQHGIVFVICVVFPGLTTSIAPASWITLQRSGEQVDCTARTCMFFVVPFNVQRISNIDRIESRVREGRTERKRQYGRSTNETVHVDGEGHLQIVDRNADFIEVSVSPASLESAMATLNAFLQNSNAPRKTVFVIANWKFGAIMGGVLTSLTLLYVVGYSLAFLNRLYLLAKRIVRGGRTEAA